jgi:protein-S-isoprenylcysteine O-methyltransferase Ste14
MTTNLLAFNAVATIYFVVGSLHEEARLRDAYGEDYDAYLNSGISFYVPFPHRGSLDSTSALTVSLGAPR